jgi:hypothetical protein
MDDDPSCHWGMTGFLTDDQEDTLKKFLDKVDLEPLRYTVESPTECALRFLRARKFNLEDSMKIVSDALQKFKDVGALLPSLSPLSVHFQAQYSSRAHPSNTIPLFLH